MTLARRNPLQVCVHSVGAQSINKNQRQKRKSGQRNTVARFDRLKSMKKRKSDLRPTLLCRRSFISIIERLNTTHLRERNRYISWRRSFYSLQPLEAVAKTADLFSSCLECGSMNTSCSTHAGTHHPSPVFSPNDHCTSHSTAVEHPLQVLQVEVPVSSLASCLELHPIAEGRPLHCQKELKGNVQQRLMKPLGPTFFSVGITPRRKSSC